MVGLGHLHTQPCAYDWKVEFSVGGIFHSWIFCRWNFPRWNFLRWNLPITMHLCLYDILQTKFNSNQQNSNQHKEFNLFNFYEQIESKTIKAIELKPRLIVAHLRIAVPNEIVLPRGVSLHLVQIDKRKSTFFGNFLD